MLAAMAPSAALAMDWTVVLEQSRVLFEYQRNDQPAGGHFATFSGEGVFDPENPAEATLELRIDSASIDLNYTMASAFATSAEWLDSANHPHVIYRLMTLTVVISVVQWLFVVALMWASCVAAGAPGSFMAATVTFLLVVLGQQLPNAPLRIGTTQLAFAIGLILSINASPASISTPASR